MAQILVRNLDPKVVKKLKARAKSQGRSLQAEAKIIMEQAAVELPRLDHKAAREMVDRIRGRLKGKKLPDSVEDIRQMREERDRRLDNL
jgi:plasmid stability protein